MALTHLLRFAAIASLALTLGACAGNKGDKDELPPEESVDSLYNKAADLMDHGEYHDASKQFAEVERQHPYSQWATKAQLMEAFADYQNLDYDEAITTLNQFIELHPGSNDAAYAFYLRALCNYERISDVRRDQSEAIDSLKGMQEVVSRFPDSPYAKDAALKISLISDHLAGAEMDVGRWYLGQKLYIAAIERFKTVVSKYQTTSHVPEALERLVECYVSLGVTKEAKATAAVLGYNFPGSEWYQDAYGLLVQNNIKPDNTSKAPAKNDDTWIGRVWHSVF